MGSSPGFSHVGIVHGRRVFSGISRLFNIPAVLHTHIASSSSALKTSILRPAQVSSLHIASGSARTRQLAQNISRRPACTRERNTISDVLRSKTFAFRADEPGSILADKFVPVGKDHARCLVGLRGSVYLIGSERTPFGEPRVNPSGETMDEVAKTRKKRATARTLSSHQIKPGLTPCGVAHGFLPVEIVPGDDAGRRVFSRISRIPPPLHSGAAPYPRRFTVIGPQDRDISSCPKLCSHLDFTRDFDCHDSVRLGYVMFNRSLYEKVSITILQVMKDSDKLSLEQSEVQVAFIMCATSDFTCQMVMIDHKIAMGAVGNTMKSDVVCSTTIYSRSAAIPLHLLRSSSSPPCRFPPCMHSSHLQSTGQTAEMATISPTLLLRRLQSTPRRGEEGWPTTSSSVHTMLLNPDQVAEGPSRIPGERRGQLTAGLGGSEVRWSGNPTASHEMLPDPSKRWATNRSPSVSKSTPKSLEAAVEPVYPSAEKLGTLALPQSPFSPVKHAGRCEGSARPLTASKK
ncbi:hypothetical protein PR048_023098 [Dryococelus australis]|uniref:Uncharacterized protein n=1 Tax=Dryococelus australis TaxID=614101 RepID=A0ABQ9GT51_9NEOP|nr:hypothetical protein PR048_023098 [Dryococelus australis]